MKYTDEELGKVLAEAVTSSEQFSSSQLARERREVLQYYRGELPKPYHSADSKYVSMDVYDGVDSMRATVLETFSAHQRIVFFKPETAEDVEACRIATDYAAFAVYRQNDGEGIYYDVLTDGLMARFGVVKSYVEEENNDREEEFSSLTEDEMDVYLAGLGTEVELTELEQEGQLYSGKATVKSGSKKIRIVSVPPENFLIAPKSKDIQSALWVAERSPKTVSDLIKMGFERKVVEKLSGGISVDYEGQTERDERFRPVEAGVFKDLGYSDETREIDVYEIYIEIDLEDTGIARLWKITMAGNTILHKERVRKKPFSIFVPLPEPHAFFGNNFGKLLAPTQNARTVLFRQIINHTVITNNPRYMVMSTAVPNPAELMDNRMGGIVNVRRQDAIAPLQQAPMNPFAFNVIALLDEDKEETTGISKLSQGLNKDAISTQNSQGMVEQLISASQQRQKIIARQFGRFVRDLYLQVYDLAITEIDQQEIVDVSGNWVEVNPQTWIERKDASIELALGYGEMEREAMKWLQIDQYLTAHPKLSLAYTDAEQYEVMRRYLRKAGIEDVESIIKPPERREQPQPTPAEQIGMMQTQAQIELTKAQAQATVINAQTAQMKAQIDMMKAKADLGVDAAKLEIEEKEFEHEVEMDHLEYELAKKTEEKTAIIAMDG